MSMSKMVIGIAGRAGAGKSTAARILRDEWGFAILPFAGPLKAMCRAFGLTALEMTVEKETPLARLGGKSPRQFMQMLGTEFGREMIGPDIWVDAWRHGLLDVMSDQCGECRVVADDCRFANEAAAIRAEGGIVLRIEREGAGSATGADHASERQEFDVDITIWNDGTEDVFAARLRGVLDRYWSSKAI